MKGLLGRGFNTKCAVISGLVLGVWALPGRRNLAVGAALVVVTYVGVAWYDELYDCDERLVARGGLFGAVSAPLKPPVTDGTYGGGMAAPRATCGGGTERCATCRLCESYVACAGKRIF